jgi:hypothetical protein
MMRAAVRDLVEWSGALPSATNRLHDFNREVK